MVWLFSLVVACLWSGLLDFEFSPSGYNAKRVAQCGLLLGILILYCLPSVRKQINHVFEKLPDLALILIILSLLFGVCSALLSEFVHKGLQEVGLYALLILNAVFLATSGLDERQLLRVIAVIGVGMGVYVFGYLFRYALYLEYPGKSWMFSIYQFSHPRTLNHTQNWLIPLFALLPLASAGQSTLIRRLSWFPVASMYFLLLVSAGRGVSLALLVFGYCLNFCLKDKKVNDLIAKRLTSILCCGIFLLGIGFFIITGWEFFFNRGAIYLILESMAPRFWENGAFQIIR